MNLSFTKMHGLGNDFMVLNLLDQQIDLTPDRIRAWSNRHTGIGFDQLLTVSEPTRPGHDFAYNIYNADGDRVQHCGNGARCLMHFIRDQGISNATSLVLELLNGAIHCTLEEDNEVSVDMGAPIFEPAQIPFHASQQAPVYPLVLDNGETLEISAVSMGNPHAVTIVDNVLDYPVSSVAPLIQNHRQFPERVNAGFMQVINPGTIRVRVYERGAGETLACGTGACAAVAAGIQRGLLDKSVLVELTCGTLQITWPGANSSLVMKGPATTVYEGSIGITDL